MPPLGQFEEVDDDNAKSVQDVIAKDKLANKMRQYNANKDWAAQVDIEAIEDPVKRDIALTNFQTNQIYQKGLRNQVKSPEGWRVGGRSRNRKSRRQKRKGTRRRYRRS